jgi:O-acetyl-ADP-ribose deacetylase
VKSKTKSKTVSAGIEAITVFLPIFEAIAPDDFAQLLGSSVGVGEIPVLGHLEYHPAVYKFMDTCYENGMVLSFDWGAWSDEAHRYMSVPQLVTSASLNTCMKLLTTHLRAERFCDGHLEGVLRSGHITAILRRLQQFRRRHLAYRRAQDPLFHLLPR